MNLSTFLWNEYLIFAEKFMVFSQRTGFLLTETKRQYPNFMFKLQLFCNSNLNFSRQHQFLAHIVITYVKKSWEGLDIGVKKLTECGAQR